MARELELKYGCNPNQKPSKIYMKNGELPIEVLNGKPGYINFLDAFNSWQLVKELKEATGLPAATSFKHVSPAGAAVGVPLSDTLKQIYFVDDLELSPLACAYAMARGADRMSSYGDFIALSDICDKETATIIAREVSDGVIAPGYTDEALEILKGKRKGNYNIVKIDENYTPEPIETKDVYGITFEQGRNEILINEDLLKDIPTDNKIFTDSAKRDLIIALITLKYTQSNSVCYAKDGQVIGVGAGQQSRIHCTRLAGNKADIWYLRQHPKVLNLKFKKDIGRPDRDNTIDVYLSDDYMDVLADGIWQTLFEEKPEPLTGEGKRAWLKTLTGVALGSDAFFPFGDNIERAKRSGVSFIAQPGGSIRDDNVILTCNKYNIVMAFTKNRLFHH
ncbi:MULTISPECIES: phosphoribosylaminoimidazolecarboxamide formyltransferase [unclassified Clostridioides]|uniref:phosphoribosylaminoimidazolecarboxamide formyltransferase n=1 Tax=unclassified Clostridioides TaxID=2635829 RepID=UPI0006BBB0AE|nr:5-aminoimidazole-4-carboxamide ribonucleotide transformylase [Clostridioides difficile]MCC0692586.1 phosphoribosylaminoimidazolecarboxamide formyltransferase [Clostridioides sp. ZZV14-6387]MDB3083812.1 5-aminoimidazole-4-carboxamide ribonucleotide formyltransferase [Clostridioides difficile]MDI7816118.1 phosphoribosylaminoimidazolecarboxamide formyltransferase [Clostridioides difficile]CZR96204.1 Bifunctional purine biosynthesis protein PurH [Clostridioides difficile]